MKRRIGLVGVVTPFQAASFRRDVEVLAQDLLRSGADVEAVYLPFSVSADMLRQIVALRMIRQQEDYEVLIALNWPAHVLRHPRKLVWHQDPFGYRSAFTQRHLQGGEADLALLDGLDANGLREAAAIYRTPGDPTWPAASLGGVTCEPILAPGAKPVAGALDWTAAVERAST
jgi:hypothetical protein